MMDKLGKLPTNMKAIRYHVNRCYIFALSLPEQAKKNNTMYNHLVSTDLSKEIGGPISVFNNKLHVEGTQSNQTLTNPPCKVKQAFIEKTTMGFSTDQKIF